MTHQTPRLSPLSSGFAGLLVAALIAIVLAAAFDLMDRELAKRLACSIFGLMMFAAGNILPKIILPISVGQTGRTDRFVGAIFVLAGLTCVGVAIFAPGDQILLIEAIVGISAFVLAGLNWLLTPRRRESRADASDPETQRAASRAKAGRMAILLILNGLFWTFLIFVADSLWGDAGARWMLVPFIIVNSLLAITQAKHFRDARG